MANLKTPRGYAEDFDPIWYLDNRKEQIYTRGILTFSLDFLHDTFGTGKYKGNLLLDIGSGPTVHSVISASRHVNEMHMADISPRNREILEKWRNGEPNVVETFEYIIKKEDYGMTLEDRVNMVREKVTQIYDVDIRLPETFPDSSGKYDIVVASLLLCAVARNKEEFTEVLKKTMTLLRPGGYLIVIGVLNQTEYEVGEFVFTNADIARGKMKGIFLKENLKIMEWKETDTGQYSPEYVDLRCSPEEGMFGIVAQRV